MSKRLLILLCIAAAVVGTVVWMWMATGGADSSGESAHEETNDAVLSGRVIDTSGRPVDGADVFAGAAHTRAGDDGRFSFADLPAEQTPVEATADGHQRGGVDELGRPTVDLSTGESVDDLLLVLPRAASISGRVVAGGRPVDDAEIGLSYKFAEGLDGDPLEPFIVSELTRSRSDGSFSLSEVAPGRLQIFVDSDEYGFAESDEIYLRQGQRRDDLTIDVAPTGGLHGTAFDEDGRPIAATITLEPDDPELTTEQTRAPGDGTFSFSALAEGRYVLYVDADGHPTEVVDDVFIRSDVDKQLDVFLDSDAAIFGRVVDPYGDPVSDAHVIIQNGVDRRLRVGDDGRFRLEEFDPDTGPFTAIASAPGHEASDERTITPGREEIFEVDAGGTVHGRVVDTDGNPVSGARIAISIAESADEIRYHARQINREAHSDDDGDFELGPLRSGRYRISADADGYPRATSDPVRVHSGSASGPITLRLEEGSTLSGIVRDVETDEPIEAAQLTFLQPVPRGRPPVEYTDADGYYEFENLSSGRHSIQISHNLYEFELAGGIELREGVHTEIDFDLQPVDPENPGQNIQGIGASLGADDEGFLVNVVHESSPAEAAGIQEGDVIISIDGSPAEELTLDMAVQRIRGEPGRLLTLQVRRPGRGIRTIDVERGRVFIPQEDRQVRHQAR